jgi:hypothetical protein
MIPQWVLLISPFIGVGIVAFAVAVISRVDPVVVLRPAETRDTADYDELVRKTADTLGRGVVTIIRQNLVPSQSVAEPAQGRQTASAQDDIQPDPVRAQIAGSGLDSAVDRSARKLADLERVEADRAATMKRAQWALASYQPASTDGKAKAGERPRDTAPPLLAGHKLK